MSLTQDYCPWCDKPTVHNDGSCEDCTKLNNKLVSSDLCHSQVIMPNPSLTPYAAFSLVAGLIVPKEITRARKLPPIRIERQK